MCLRRFLLLTMVLGCTVAACVAAPVPRDPLPVPLGTSEADVLSAHTMDEAWLETVEKIAAEIGTAPVDSALRKEFKALASDYHVDGLLADIHGHLVRDDGRVDAYIGTTYPGLTALLKTHDWTPYRFFVSQGLVSASEHAADVAAYGMALPDNPTLRQNAAFAVKYDARLSKVGKIVLF